MGRRDRSDARVRIPTGTGLNLKVLMVGTMMKNQSFQMQTELKEINKVDFNHINPTMKEEEIKGLKLKLISQQLAQKIKVT